MGPATLQHIVCLLFLFVQYVIPPLLVESQQFVTITVRRNGERQDIVRLIISIHPVLIKSQTK